MHDQINLKDSQTSKSPQNGLFQNSHSDFFANNEYDQEFESTFRNLTRKILGQ